MRYVRSIAIAVLSVAALICLAAPWIAPADYATQFREDPAQPPSQKYLLGTDDLGRDRLSRLVYGTRISLALAPAAALIATALAALIGGIAGYCGGWVERLGMTFTDLFLAVPWLFLLVTVRAALPLNVSPEISVAITFGLLGFFGWAASARVICAGTRSLMDSDFMLLARASGAGGLRVVLRQLLPNLRPVLLAQFWISIPVFILTEATLGVLGLGVAEPLPSWGSILREMESFAALGAQPWMLFPLGLLIATVSAFQILLSRKESFEL